MEILRIEDLTFRYPGTESDALSEVSLSVDAGEFVVLCGGTGSGKTTLLKLCKREIAPFGDVSGRIIYGGEPLSELEDRKSAGEIGYVTQDPDDGIVTDKVWHELAFGLENLGTEPETIRRRVGEMASYFGLGSIFRSRTDELSGGQKQALNLASVMVMQPRLLLLDEPTGQLDPIAASEFISMIMKLNRELGLTVILAEHRLEDVFPVADKVVLMDGGKIAACGSPRDVCGSDVIDALPVYGALPSAVRISRAVGYTGRCPLTVREGRDLLLTRYSKCASDAVSVPTECKKGESSVEMKDVWFRYEKNSPDILRGLSLTAYKGEFCAVLGGNGSGKTTTLRLIAGLMRPYRGKIRFSGENDNAKKVSAARVRVAMLPQDPSVLFAADTVWDDLFDMALSSGIKRDEAEACVSAVMARLGTSRFAERHPLDLSGGERQKCALAKLLLTDPDIILLDEPTKGLDASSKLALAGIVDELKSEGKTVVAVTHDVEFAAENADRCALLFDGAIISTDVPSRFFPENNFYTTAANRMARDLIPSAVTCGDVIEWCHRCRERAEI